MTLKLVITPGEPAGIGPELVVRMAQNARSVGWIVAADEGLLQRAAERLGLPLVTDRALDNPSRNAGTLTILQAPLGVREQPGVLDVRNAPYVIDTLMLAVRGCLRGEFAAVVTGPVQKSIINDAGYAFSGHTEFFCEQAGSPDVVMLLATDRLKVALATTHLPLAQVPAAITAPLLERRLGILIEGLRRQFRCAAPRILVAGLNPHAGESGHLGREEIDVIAPVCEGFRARGERVEGPLPADTLFTPSYLARADAVFAMYHDQGLPVLKSHGFGRAVNVTLGLPFVRTSVDHGTALDLAGRGTADTGSFEAALELAAELSG